MTQYQTRRQRIAGFDAEKTKQLSARRRGLRDFDIAVNGVVVAQFEFYATAEGFFVESRGQRPFQHRIA